MRRPRKNTRAVHCNRNAELIEPADLPLEIAFAAKLAR